MVHAASVQLSWNPSQTTTNGPLTYKAYWGGSTTNYTNSVFVGTNLTAVITNLSLGSTYYFSATATDTNGIESDYAVEVPYTLPPKPLPPSGLTVTVVVNVNVNVK